jgi:hypothetical protein
MRKLAEKEEEKVPEMSRMSVPVLSLERSPSLSSREKRRDRGRKSGKKVPRATTETPAKEPISAEATTPERMLAPTPPSPSTSFLLTGSEFIYPVKVRISPKSQEGVAKELQEAMSDNFFNVWPTVEDERPGREAKGEMEESGVFVAAMEEGVRKRREELMREWKLKGEKGVQGRRRVKEGWESVVEGGVLRGVEGFRPTLGTCFEDGDGVQDFEWLEQEEKSRESTRKSMGDKDAQARGHDWERKSSKVGTERKSIGGDSGGKENRLTQSKSQSKPNRGPKIGSREVSTRQPTRFRPWSRDGEEKENSEDDYPFDVKPRQR